MKMPMTINAGQPHTEIIHKHLHTVTGNDKNG